MSEINRKKIASTDYIATLKLVHIIRMVCDLGMARSFVIWARLEVLCSGQGAGALLFARFVVIDTRAQVVVTPRVLRLLVPVRHRQERAHLVDGRVVDVAMFDRILVVALERACSATVQKHELQTTARRTTWSRSHSFCP